MDRSILQFWKSVPDENKIARKLKSVRNEAKLVAEGKAIAAFICGPPGIGKTKAIADGLKSSAHKPLYANPCRVTLLLDAFHETEGKRPLVLEEADVIFRTSANLNVLKKATDAGGDRFYYPHITDVWSSEKEKMVREKVRVDLRAPLLVSTNEDLSQSISSETAAHFAAVYSRCPPIIVPDDRAAICEWAIYLSLTSTLISYDNAGVALPLKTRAAALKWLSENRDRLADVSPRAIRNIALIVHQRGQDAQARLEDFYDQSLARAPQRNCDVDWAKLRMTMTESDLV
jgi:hypothetical protein